MSKRQRLTVADYAVVALCPTLIVLLLASLVYFVILCVYHGQYASRLGYIWFMFILGAVGIARISIQQSRGYATGYAAVLGLATFFVLSRFQMLGGSAAALTPLVNALLIATVWFLADRITFDCTLIDEDQDASGQGLLDGLASRTDDADQGFTHRDAADRNRRPRRARQPGRTVLWLTAAALPLFGLGQFLLRADPQLQRGAMFALAMYLFATLSLLVATSFLGVRRYLRSRGVEMPANVSTAWLGGGVLVAALILLLCFALPQPGRMLAKLELPPALQSPDWLSPSRYGWGSETADPTDNSESSRGAPGEDQAGEQGDSGNQAGQASEPNGAVKQSSSEQSGNDQSSGGEQAGGEQSGGEQNGGDEPSNSAQQASDPEQQASAGRDSDDTSPIEGQTTDRSAQDRQGGEANNSEASSPPAEPAAETAEADSQSSPPPKSAAQQPPPSAPLSEWIPSLSWLIKAIIYLVLVAIIAAFLWLHRAALADGWQRLMAWFAGRGREPAPAAGESTAGETTITARPFASFSNPLTMGTSPRRAVVETFQAAEAWYREQGQPRKLDETPHEYSLRLKTIDAAERRAISRLAEAYNRIVYGGGAASPRDLQTVQEVWQVFCVKAPHRS